MRGNPSLRRRAERPAFTPVERSRMPMSEPWPDQLRQGKASFERRMWSTAFLQLSSADQHASLPPEDLEMLAMAAQLSGRETEVNELLMRVHQMLLDNTIWQPSARIPMPGDVAPGGI